MAKDSHTGYVWIIFLSVYIIIHTLATMTFHSKANFVEFFGRISLRKRIDIGGLVLISSKYIDDIIP